MALHSVRPYLIRDGKAWCASCRRHRLARIVGTRFVCCPSCDGDREVEAGPRTVSVVGRELRCGQCGRSAMVRGPAGVGFECPVCDTPPWERDKVGQPAVINEALPGLGDAAGAGDVEERPDRPARPAPLVARCFFCLNTCWHDYEWRQVKWVAVCRGCGNRLSASRTKSVRVQRRKGRGE